MRKPTKIQNVKDLTNSLVSVYEDVLSNKITEKKAREIANISAKVITTAKANLEYNRYMKYKRKIAFLETI